MAPFTSTLHKLWRVLPREKRRRAMHAVFDALAPGPTPLSRVKPGPVIVGGQLTTASGLGEGARLCLNALRGLGWDAQHKDISHFFLRPDLPESIAGEEAAPGTGGTLVLHVNSPFIPYVMMRLGRRFIAGRKIIGNWAWELPQTGPDWKRGLPFVHEIWVSTRFIADALPKENRVPVKIVHYPVRTPAAVPARDRFGLPANAFVVLTAFDMGSSYIRKNPTAAVTAFRKAFGDDPNCILVLKVGHSSDAGWAMQDLQNAIAGMTNIRLIDETLTRPDMAALVASADAILSLHRAEGFGLLMAEAMLLGIPAIATGWSGNLDFMTADNSVLIDYTLVPAHDPQGTYNLPGVNWADADTAQAAAALIRLRGDKGFREALATRARSDMAQQFSPEAYRRAIGGSLPPP